MVNLPVKLTSIHISATSHYNILYMYIVHCCTYHNNCNLYHFYLAYICNVRDYHRLFGMHNILLNAQGLIWIHWGEKNPSISPLHKKIILQHKQLYEAQICGCSYNFKCGLSLYSLGQNLSYHSLWAQYFSLWKL